MREIKRRTPPQPVDAAAGRAVRRARNAAGMSIPELASLLGWHHNKLQALETGQKSWFLHDLHHVQVTLGVKIATLPQQ